MVTKVRMCVADASRHLDEFADMPDEEHLLKAGFRRHPHCVINEIGGGHRRRQGKAVLTTEKHLPVIAGRRGKDRQSLFSKDSYLDLNRIKQGLVTHRLHNSAGPQNGDSSHDPEFGVEGPGRQLPPLRNENDDIQSGRSLARAAQHIQDCLPYHPPRRTVDRRVSHRLVQSGPGHTPHALSAVDPDARRVGERDFSTDQCAIRDIRVVSAVFSHRAGDRLPFLNADLLDVQDQLQPFGRL